jgi:flavin reductase (DIM6/NTAB) family NADH-FMN oxidoreductase RutF
MRKVTLGPKTLVYPMPTFLVGANVDGKPNFMALAWGGIANGEPPMVSVAIRPSRHTHKGISQNGTFSVNIPSADLVKEADYCGIASGAKEDKVSACGFKIFYGKLGSAPLIEQCPINLECRVVQSLSLGSHTLFIGKIEEVHVSADCLTDGKPDVDKIKPLIYITEPERAYRACGKEIAKGFKAGLEIKERK